MEEGAVNKIEVDDAFGFVLHLFLLVVLQFPVLQHEVSSLIEVKERLKYLPADQELRRLLVQEAFEALVLQDGVRPGDATELAREGADDTAVVIDACRQVHVHPSIKHSLGGLVKGGGSVEVGVVLVGITEEGVVLVCLPLEQAICQAFPIIFALFLLI